MPAPIDHDVRCPARTAGVTDTSQSTSRASTPSSSSSSSISGTYSSGTSAGDQEAHHLVHQRRVGRRWQDAAAVAVGRDHLERLGAHRGLGLGAHEALHLVQVDPRSGRAPPAGAGVAGHVDHRHQQRRHADVLERRGDRGVVVGDGRTRVAVDRGDGLGHGASGGSGSASTTASRPSGPYRCGNASPVPCRSSTRTSTSSRARSMRSRTTS